MQKKQPITDTAAAMLRRQGLIEGRKPHYFVSAKVAAATDTGASYTRSKGLEKQKLKEFILQHLHEFGPAPRAKLEELLFEMLPADLTEKKKRNKVKNLLTEMRAKDKTIKRIGKGPKSKWTFFNGESFKMRLLNIRLSSSESHKNRVTFLSPVSGIAADRFASAD